MRKERGHLLRLERNGQGAFASHLLWEAAGRVVGEGAVGAIVLSANVLNEWPPRPDLLAELKTTRAEVERAVAMLEPTEVSEDHEAEKGSELWAFCRMYRRWPKAIRDQWLFAFDGPDQYRALFPDAELRRALAECGGRLVAYDVPRSAVKRGRTQCVFDRRKARKAGEMSPTHFDG